MTTLYAVESDSSRFTVGTSVTIHYSDSIKTNGTVVGHTGTGAYKIAAKGREHCDPIVASAEKVTLRIKATRAPKGCGPLRGKLSAGVRLQRFLESSRG